MGVYLHCVASTMLVATLYVQVLQARAAKLQQKKSVHKFSIAKRPQRPKQLACRKKEHAKCT